ncbi:GNAT family N-acetyltransferase [Aureibacillus halotolerans]|uniref:GNAT acetyltransferase-like protein n=1 Tax=Aureibacillus halotolerans TaxID=1508390 RepID=A0A4R6U5G3_9BACI|nr:GNAT family N-acetyltransferase [Aureibacillus halotolerans]TDQ40782.1 GNAT acetyltransferase-like protein [Aureibacillus halotolerans]
MMHELSKDLFFRCLPLLNEQTNLEVRGVIEGNNLGRVFVNQLECPSVALIWLGNNDGFFFIGQEDLQTVNDHLLPWVEDNLVEEIKVVGLNQFEMISVNQVWEEAFSERAQTFFQQNVYLYPPSMPLHQFSDIDTAYTLKKLTTKLLDDQRNGHVKADILTTWPSIEDFLKVGVGYGVLYEDTIVSYCLSIFVGSDQHCVMISTDAAHRGKGCAKASASAFINECHAKGVTPYWDCTTTNEASVAVAEQLGFECIATYRVYAFDFPGGMIKSK